VFVAEASIVTPAPRACLLMGYNGCVELDDVAPLPATILTPQSSPTAEAAPRSKDRGRAAQACWIGMTRDDVHVPAVKSARFLALQILMLSAAIRAPRSPHHLVSPSFQSSTCSSPRGDMSSFF
jgi:hypothetical protein